jgi:DNA polymerase-1
MILSMAKTGLQVDLDHFAKMETNLVEDMDRITEEVHTLTGHYINLDSGDQVSDLLFKRLKLKQARFKLTRSGDRESVEDEVLTAIQHDHPVVPLILSYKEYSKLLGTYVVPIPKLVRRAPNGLPRMYPNFSTTRVPSGRLSCKQPNLLAMPTRTKRGRDVRKGFVAAEGWVLVTVDESQIEVRLAAHSSGDPALIRVYFNEEDIYSDFAITAFKLKDSRFRDDKGWHYPGVDKMNHRYPAKTCILASIYDVTAKGLLEQMPPGYGWTEDKCQDLINAFYMKYPGILEDRRRYHRIARRLGYTYDMWGRILQVAAVRSIHPWVVGAALREVGNFPYQSGAQGTIKLTMAAVWDDLEQSNMLDVVHPLLQVHDELLFECREDVADELIEVVKYRFETCAPLRVPLIASGAKAQNWGSLEK